MLNRRSRRRKRREPQTRHPPPGGSQPTCSHGPGFRDGDLRGSSAHPKTHRISGSPAPAGRNNANAACRMSLRLRKTTRLELCRTEPVIRMHFMSVLAAAATSPPAGHSHQGGTKCSFALPVGSVLPARDPSPRIRCGTIPACVRFASSRSSRAVCSRPPTWISRSAAMGS